MNLSTSAGKKKNEKKKKKEKRHGKVTHVAGCQAEQVAAEPTSFGSHV